MTNKIDISTLIANAKKGIWSAQKELYLHYADQMMSIAIRYTKDQSSAKDLVQDSFLKFFEKIDQFDLSKGKPGPWISRILINRALQNIKKESRLSFDTVQVFQQEQSRETSVIETLEAEDILNLLNKIPKGCRVIFNLKVVEGYDHNEIGKMLGITAGASRSQLSRAKMLLRNLIEEQENVSGNQDFDQQSSLLAG